jgi:3-oxoacyl-[acyl-carrier protein] reductase
MRLRRGGASEGESVANERKVCIVTGSSSGIGAATVRLYAERGWDVVVNYSRDVAPADAVAADCRALGAQALVVRADVAVDADCRRLGADDFQHIYSVNVIGAYQMVRALVPLIERSGGGAVVNVSSIASMMGTGSSLAYMASKGALNALSVGLARALAPQIRVNAIAPGLVETPWMEKGLGAERYAATVAGYRARAALDAVIAPEDVAEAAWFLGVGAAKTTGEVLLLDAGLRLRRD